MRGRVGGGSIMMTTDSLAKLLESLPNVVIEECSIKLSTGMRIGLLKEVPNQENKSEVAK